jgi:hypothetical protein
MPDRFLRGGAEDQPETYSDGTREFFRRTPLITETKALYQ